MNRLRTEMLALALVCCVWPGLTLADIGTLQGAPRVDPQDVWIAFNGNNNDGFLGGGSICFRLAQGFGPGDSATALTDVFEAGIYGIDGTPVPPGTYEFPSEVFGSMEQTLEPGSHYYVIADAYVVESTIEDFPFPPGSSFTLMFTFPWEGDGRHVVTFGAWADFGDGVLVNFLNEGPMMYNIWTRRSD